jgi:hypothetical protein
MPLNLRLKNSVSTKNRQKEERTIKRGRGVMNGFVMTYQNYLLERFTMRKIQLGEQIRWDLHALTTGESTVENAVKRQRRSLGVVTRRRGESPWSPPWCG